MNRVLLATALAAIAALGGARGAHAQVILTLEGECPGHVVVQWEGATPDRPAAIAFSRREGQVTLPAGPCEGTVLGLSSAHHFGVVRVFRTGPEGRGQLTGRAHLTACGGYLQMIVMDGNPCATSNVVQIPQ